MNKGMLGITMVSLLLASSVLLATSSGVVAQELDPEITYRTSEARAGPTPHFNPIAYWNIGAGMEFVYEELAYYNQQNGKFEPWLAEDWEWTDEHTLLIRLRPEAHFRDGSPVTADDVVFSLKTLANPNYTAVLASFFEKVESISATGKREISVKLKESTLARTNLAIQKVFQQPIFPKERWSKLLDEYGEDIGDYINKDYEGLNGSGPYTLAKATEEGDIYEKVSDYWGNEIGWYFSPRRLVDPTYWGTTDKAIRMYRKKDINTNQQHGAAMADLPEFLRTHEYRDCWSINAESRSKMFRGPDIGFDVVPNPEKPILRNRWLRYALAYAIKYKDVTEKSQPGGFANSPAFVSPRASGVGPYINKDLITDTFETETRAGVIGLKYSPDKAVEILKEHCEGSVDEGWTYKGQKLGGWTIMAVNGWTDVMAQARLVSEHWEDIGIKDVKPVFYEYGQWNSKYKAFDYDWVAGYNAIKPPFPIANNFNNYFLTSKVGGWSVWNTPLPYPDYYPEEAEKIEPLVKELWGLPYGSEEAIQIAKEIQEIYVPQLYMIPLYGRPSWYRWITSDWVNWPTADDPHEHQFSILGAEDFLFVKHLRPRCVEITDFTIAPGVVEIGEPATAKITLKNTGDYDHEYAVYIRKGSAKVGPGPEILAHAGPIVPSGGTKTIELGVTFDEAGSYTLTVDDWRLGDTSSNPGEPIEKTLIVEEAEEIGLAIPEEFPEKVDMAIETAQDAKETAQEAVTAAQSAKTSADEAKTAAEEARDLAKEAAEKPTGASTGMVIASMVITIIVVLAGVYVITGRRAV